MALVPHTLLDAADTLKDSFPGFYMGFDIVFTCLLMCAVWRFRMRVVLFLFMARIILDLFLVAPFVSYPVMIPLSCFALGSLLWRWFHPSRRYRETVPQY